MLPRILLTAILVSSVLATGCKQFAKTIGELQVFQAALTKKFGDTVYVNATGSSFEVLTITFINSALNEKSPADRVKRAEETAQFVKANYRHIQSVREVWVVFLRQKSWGVVFHQNEAFEVYGFDKEANRLSLPGSYDPAPRPDPGITAGHTGSSDETDISAGIFQLDGEPGGYGMTLQPYFRLQGDARRWKAPPPEKVFFSIASYSKKPRFREPVPFEFIADGKPLMKGTMTFTGNDAQFGGLSIAYPTFRKIVTGKALTIKLGAKEYPLTPEQFEILQKMDAYVQQ